MNFYSIIKLNRKINNHRLKFLGLWTLYQLRKRYLAVHFDPVLACNLRCKMCYFTDKEYVKKMKGIFPEDDLNRWAQAILPRAMKLQIGCGTEPTLYKQLPEIVRLGKKFEVPYISLTTNANLLDEVKIRELAAAGLGEFTISLHGVHKEEYENFMGKASYEAFHNALKGIKKVKEEFPKLNLRINYTFNKDNFYSLTEFFEIYGHYQIDYLQLRPMKIMGDTEYQDTDLSDISNDYNRIMKEMKERASANNTQLIANTDFESLHHKVNTASYIRDFTYCYISPKYFWREGFDWKNEDIDDFNKRQKFGYQLFSHIFKSGKTMREKELKSSLNYDII